MNRQGMVHSGNRFDTKANSMLHDDVACYKCPWKFFATFTQVGIILNVSELIYIRIPKKGKVQVTEIFSTIKLQLESILFI